MEQHGNQNNEKNRQMEKRLKHLLFMFPFLLNRKSLSELSDLENTKESFGKSKCGGLKILRKF